MKKGADVSKELVGKAEEEHCHDSLEVGGEGGTRRQFDRKRLSAGRHCRMTPVARQR